LFYDIVEEKDPFRFAYEKMKPLYDWLPGSRFQSSRWTKTWFM